MLGRLLSFVVVGLLAFAGSALAQGKAELQWFSQAGFKLTTPGGKVIMIDPWIKGATKLPDEFKDLGKLGKGRPDPGDARPRRCDRCVVLFTYSTTINRG